MKYLSVCSGIEAATVAWHPLGWEPVAFSEIEAFPRAVLSHHYPDVPLHGDFTEMEIDDYGAVDLLAGGTPCQDGSIGNPDGRGLDGPRSSLAFDFADLADGLGAEWIVWENVPNLLSARHSNSFLRFCARLGEFGYHCAWRVLDQQYLGQSDQPRPRLIVVGNRRSAQRAAAVLLEPQSFNGNCQPRQETAPVLVATGGMALDDRTPCILDGNGPRIATPLEWERAMGFPDNYTLVPYRGKPASDTPRYRALGNSQAIPVMRWLGERIDMVSQLRSAA